MASFLLNRLPLRSEASDHGCFSKHDHGASTEQHRAFGLPQVTFGLDINHLSTTPGAHSPSTEEASGMSLNRAADRQPKHTARTTPPLPCRLLFWPLFLQQTPSADYKYTEDGCAPVLHRHTVLSSVRSYGFKFRDGAGG